MATWKKVIVSGSVAQLNNLSVDNNVTLTGSLNVGANQQITTSVNSTFLSGSFSGSFHGDGSDLTGIVSDLYISASRSGSDSNMSISLKTSPLIVSGSTTKGLYVLAGGNTLRFDLAQNLTTTGIVTFDSVTATSGFTGSFSGSAVLPILSNGTGISAFTYNGSGVASVAVSGAAALTTNYLTKWSGTSFLNSNISDNGSIVTVAVPATFDNNVIIQGDLTVNGTASFINTQELLVKDKFTLFNSGSTGLTDTGFIFQYNQNFGTALGSALYLDSANGSYGRFAVAYDVAYNTTAVTADEWMVTVKQSTANPSTNPTWGGASGYGSMWVNTNSGDIFIWA